MKDPFEKTSRPARARGPRLGTHPSISAVVLADHGVGSLKACLDSLIAQSGELDLEIVVVQAGVHGEERFELEPPHPSLRFVPVPSGTSLGQRRAAGMAAAEGDIVTFIEEGRLAPSLDWMTRLPWSRGGETPAPHTAGDPTLSRPTYRQGLP